MLIGFDFEYYTRDRGGGSATASENYLTGARLVAVRESERRKGGEFYYARTKASRERLKPARVSFDESFLKREGGYIEVRPF